MIHMYWVRYLRSNALSVAPLQLTSSDVRGLAAPPSSRRPVSPAQATWSQRSCSRGTRLRAQSPVSGRSTRQLVLVPVPFTSYLQY